MSQSALVRPATASDLPAVAAIYSYYVKHSTSTFEIEDPGVAEITRRWSDISDRKLPFLVAEVNGVPAGYGYAGPYRQRRAYRFTVEDSVYIHPDYLRRGFGRQLLAAIIRECQAGGAQQMIAIVGDSANIASVRLHAAHGFRTIGTLEGVGLKFGRWVDTVIMQRSLQP